MDQICFLQLWVLGLLLLLIPLSIISCSLTPSAFLYPSPTVCGSRTQGEGLLAKQNITGQGAARSTKDFSVTLLKHSINPSLAAHFFPHCSLGLCPFRLRVCQRRDSVLFWEMLVQSGFNKTVPKQFTSHPLCTSVKCQEHFWCCTKIIKIDVVNK